MSKLIECEVAAARRLYRAGASFEELGRRYGVCRTTIRAAILGKMWGHLPGAVAVEEIRRVPVMLSEESVAEMRRLYRSGATFKTLGKRFGVSSTTCSHAVTGKTWKNVPGAVDPGEVRRPRIPELTETVLNEIVELPATDLPVIRRLYSQGVPTRAIGKCFGVTSATVRVIGKGLA